MDRNAEFVKVKQFLEDVLVLHGMPKSMAHLLFELLAFINLQENLIINSFLKNDLASKTKMNKGTIDNSITKLNEVGLLIRLGRGTYALHPVLNEAQKLLKNKTAKMEIIYKEQIRIIETE
jgi:predicted transcriptional regulator